MLAIVFRIGVLFREVLEKMCCLDLCVPICPGKLL
jgi:hypothetical protein